jgi:hypothetical protein
LPPALEASAVSGSCQFSCGVYAACIATFIRATTAGCSDATSRSSPISCSDYSRSGVWCGCCTAFQFPMRPACPAPRS